MQPDYFHRGTWHNTKSNSLIIGFIDTNAVGNNNNDYKFDFSLKCAAAEQTSRVDLVAITGSNNVMQNRTVPKSPKS